MKKIFQTLLVNIIVILLATPAHSQCQNNLIVNGDFESGNVGLYTDYIYMSPDTLPGDHGLHPDQRYTIVSDPHDAQPDGFISISDHTSGEGTKMLVANGAKVNNKILWQQTVDVVAERDFIFTYWLVNVHHSGYQPPIIQTYINGILIGEFIQDGTFGIWEQVNHSWRAEEGVNKAEIRLIDRNLAYAGNDFAIDDLCFWILPRTVDIDIKPGSYPNPINQGSNGLIPVAIFSSPEFDATTVDPTTVELGGATVAVRGKGNSMAHDEDVNGDGLTDLVVQVETSGLDEVGEDGIVTLTAVTTDGTSIEGNDVVVIVPPNK